MEAECKLQKFPEAIQHLELLAKQAETFVTFGSIMKQSEFGSDWVEIKVDSGWAAIRTLLKIEGKIAVSDNQFDPGTKFPEHQHEGYEIFIVYEGPGFDLFINNKTERIKPKKPYYLNASMKHSAYAEAKTRVIAITIPDDKDWPEDKYEGHLPG